MEKRKHLLTRILAILGTVLVWLPIAAPLLLGLLALIIRGTFLLDWLMPAELSLLALLGGAILVGVAIWVERRLPKSVRLRKSPWIFAGYAAMVLLLAGIMIVPAETGLASGRVQPGGWQEWLVLGILAGYVLAMAALGIGGIMLVMQASRGYQRIQNE